MNVGLLRAGKVAAAEDMVRENLNIQRVHQPVTVHIPANRLRRGKGEL